MLLLVCPALAAAQSDLERARTLYNAGQYDESIAAAALAKNKPAAAPSATLIAARSRLERFRQKNDPADLGAARADLVSLNPRTLAPQEVIEWQIGIGTALFLENQPGPAAEMFATILPTARGRLPAAEFDKLVEWWASTVARVAESQTGPARKEAYSAMLSAVRSELERSPLSGPLPTGWSWPRAAQAISTGRGTRRSPAGFAPARSPRVNSSAATSTASSPRRSSPSGPRLAPASASMPGHTSRNGGPYRAVARPGRTLAARKPKAHPGRGSTQQIATTRPRQPQVIIFLSLTRLF